MVDNQIFCDALIRNKISFFTGVPDSLLKDFCAYISDQKESVCHIIAANEGNATALAAGHYLATGNPCLVYMQNSGLGNALNPLISLADHEAYSIPMLLLIGWRGEPDTEDEPQHVKQGKITLPLLETLGIKYDIIPNDSDEAIGVLDVAVDTACTDLSPYGLVVRKGIFARYESSKQEAEAYSMIREEVINEFVSFLGPEDVVISTTGKISRELFECRATLGQEQFGRDFLMVGSMGHASQIALGVALAHPDRQVFCLDGDGSLIMHLGSLAIIGSQQPRNLKIVILNNGAHDSVGGQPTAGFDIDIPAAALACGFETALKAETRQELRCQQVILKATPGPSLLEIRVKKGARSDLGRPTITPVENKLRFMEFLKS